MHSYKCCNFFDMYQYFHRMKQLLSLSIPLNLLFCVFLDVCWVFAVLLLEAGREIARRAEAYLIGHFCHSFIGGFEQFHGPFEAHLFQQFYGRHTRHRLHLTIELHTADAHVGSKIIHLQLHITHILQDSLAQRVHKHLVGRAEFFLLFMALRRLLLLCGKDFFELLSVSEQTGNMGEKHFSAERFGEIGVCALAESFGLLLFRAACGEQDDGDIGWSRDPPSAWHKRSVRPSPASSRR